MGSGEQGVSQGAHFLKGRRKNISFLQQAPQLFRKELGVWVLVFTSERVRVMVMCLGTPWC